MNSVNLCDEFHQSFPEEASKLCIKAFYELSQSGKPSCNEWTVLCCIVKCDLKESEGCRLEVVALGTGSKCLGRSTLPSNGDKLHDSHAEIIASRAFKLYLLDQLKNSLEGRESVFCKGREFTLKEKVSFHLFCTNMPCGDASIFPNDASSHETYIPQYNNVGEDLSLKSISTKPIEVTSIEASDIYRTGAKCAPNEICDPKMTGTNYHITGVLRTKPGRGDQTLSHSCSDKMFKWTVLGIQGAILMLFLRDPIYIRTVIIGSDHFDASAFYRSLYSRFEEKIKSMVLFPPFSVHTPRIMQSGVHFDFAKPIKTSQDSEISAINPSPTSIIWSCTPIHRDKAEVAVDGKRLGTTKKNYYSYKSRVSICRIELLRKTVDLINCIAQQTDMTSQSSSVQNPMRYCDIKALSVPYQNMWNELRNAVLKNWTEKPGHLKCFVLDQPQNY